MDIPFCVEITSLGGVKLPKSIKAFDCRVPDDQIFTYVTPWGSKPLGSERAEVALGLRTGPSWDDWNATTPMSMSGYSDFRTASDDKLATVAREMRKEIASRWREWRHALNHQSTNGGSCIYKPLAVVLSNYGWGLVCDRREVVIRAFGSL